MSVISTKEGIIMSPSCTSFYAFTKPGAGMYVAIKLLKASMSISKSGKLAIREKATVTTDYNMSRKICI